MKNTYSKTKWIDNKTPVNADNLNKIENAINKLFVEAVDKDTIIDGDGISVSKNDGVKINVDNTVLRSDSCRGLEVTESEPEEPISGRIYFIIDSETKKLKKVQLNSITIFEV